ncbi:MAG TPA: MFS transporter [Ruminococcaceae bacterium]|nr:MFS transporter [Oscillospiraceae bacterium]
MQQHTDLPKSKIDRSAPWVKKIALFFTSQTISMFGSSVVQFALIWYITRTSGSGVIVAVSTIFAFLPQVLISLFAGVWADRYDRKKLIILADASIAVTTLVLAMLMIAGYQSVWMMVLTGAIRSVGAGIQAPAVNALVPQIVPKEHLVRVNGVNSTMRALVNLAAPAVGGAVLSFGPVYFVMFIDLLTAVIGIGILLFIKIPAHERALQIKTEKTDYLADLKQGVKYALSSSFIRRLLIAYALFMILAVPGTVMNVLYVTRVFGDEYWKLTFNEIAFFVGMTVGGLAVAAWGGFKNRLVTLMLGSCVFGVCTLVIGLLESFIIYLIIIMIDGLSVPMLNIPVMTLLQEKVANEMQGRIFSLLQIAEVAFMMIGLLVFGPLADSMSLRILMIASGISLTVISVAMMGFKSFIKEGLPAPAES